MAKITPIENGFAYESDEIKPIKVTNMVLNNVDQSVGFYKGEMMLVSYYIEYTIQGVTYFERFELAEDLLGISEVEAFERFIIPILPERFKNG